MKNKVIDALIKCLDSLNYPSDKIIIQNTKNPEHGDFTSNIAMILAGKLKQSPQKIATEIINSLLEVDSYKIFINIIL